MNEPSAADNQCMSSKDVENHEQNCIVRDSEDWRAYSCTLETGLSPSSGYWCADASPETINTARRRRLSNAMYRGRRTARCEFVGWESTPACLCELPDETFDPCESVPRPLLHLTPIQPSSSPILPLYPQPPPARLYDPTALASPSLSRITPPPPPAPAFPAFPPPPPPPPDPCPLAGAQST